MALGLAGLAQAPSSPPQNFPQAVGRKASAFVPTDPYLAFSGVKSTLRGELELSAQFAGLDRDIAADAVDCLSRQLDLSHLLDRDPFTLSGGEAMRAAVALAAAKPASLFVTDEIYGALAQDTIERVRSFLSKLQHGGCRVFETFNRAPAWIAEYDQILRLSEPGEAENSHYAPTQPEESEGVPLLSAEGLTCSYGPDAFGIGPIDIEVYRGEVLALIGANGAGKTTLLKALAQLLPAEFSRVRLGERLVAGPTPDRSQRRAWPRHVLYVFQNPDDQIYCATVEAELLETARLLGVSDRTARAGRIARTLGLLDLLHQTPASLPRPARRLLTAGSALVAAPPVILFDEPTAGLDPFQSAALGTAIEAYRLAGGAVAMVSHDLDFVSRHATRRAHLANGLLIKSAKTACT
jgi:energy-coupling factor transport system ATP-binding protein